VRRLRRFAGLRTDERRLLVRTAILMPVFRLALWLLPFRQVAALAEHDRTRLPEPGACHPDRIAWAIRAVSRYVPKATCLVQALTAKVLLENSGFPTLLHIGVARSEQDRFEAHAWVETQGKVITGDCDLDRYSRLLLWDSRLLIERSK